MLETAIAAAPAPDAALLYLLAESQRQVKDYAAASATLATLRKTFPDDVRGLMMDAQLKRSRGERAAALAAFASLVERVPDASGIAYQYAQLLEEAGRLPEAEAVLRSVLARDPKDATALNALGYMFADRGVRLPEAVELLQRALTIEPGNPSFLDSLGWAFFRQGQLREAEAPLVEAAAKLPRNSVIQDHLGDLRFRQARYADAVAAWERALAGDGESIDRATIQQKLREARALAVVQMTRPIRLTGRRAAAWRRGGLRARASVVAVRQRHAVPRFCRRVRRGGPGLPRRADRCCGTRPLGEGGGRRVCADASPPVSRHLPRSVSKAWRSAVRSSSSPVMMARRPCCSPARIVSSATRRWTASSRR